MLKVAVILILVAILLIVLKFSLSEDNKKAVKRLKFICDEENQDYTEILGRVGVSEKELSIENPNSIKMAAVLDEMNITLEYFTQNKLPRYNNEFYVKYLCNNCGHSFTNSYVKGTEILQQESNGGQVCTVNSNEIVCPQCSLNNIKKAIQAMGPSSIGL